MIRLTQLLEKINYQLGQLMVGGELTEPAVNRSEDFQNPSTTYNWNWLSGAKGLGLNAYRIACVLAMFIMAIRLFNGAVDQPSKARKGIAYCLVALVVVEIAVAALDKSQDMTHESVKDQMEEVQHGGF